MKLLDALKKTSGNKAACRETWNIKQPIIKPIFLDTTSRLITGKILTDRNIKYGADDMEANDWKIVDVPQSVLKI
ncbi:hypothetical protein [uncultured Limosilactobacillus sp.]|uniref:hypothetical protein n=1 Tax=uncultured Limosilactobacillus sp. TaxID=2837629 RepID=UPI0025E5569E|nr:hypothetical protein [uncultured Limosilactobacillus sp.]